MTFVVAGHGVGLVADLLVRGSADEWLPGRLFGLLGMVTCIASVAFDGLKYIRALAVGAGALVVSVAAIACAADRPLITLVTALPLVTIWTAILWMFVRERRRLQAESRATRS